MNTKVKVEKVAADQAEDQKKPGQEVGTKANTEVSSDVDFGDDAGKGMENMSKDEMIIPFMRVLQALSPQCKPPREGGTPGAQAGMIFNTATGAMFDGEVGFDFIPVKRDHNYPEWTPRDAGGGFHGIKADDDPEILELRAKQGAYTKLKTSRGTEFAEAFYLYGIVIIPETGLKFRALVPFTSTQIKKYKSFLNRVDNIRYESKPGEFIKPPMWAHRWHIGTQPEKNKKGDFYGWTMTMAAKDEKGAELPHIKSLIPRKDPLYQEAKEFHELITGGKAKVDYEKSSGAGDGSEVPFET